MQVNAPGTALFDYSLVKVRNGSVYRNAENLLYEMNTDLIASDFTPL